MKNQEKISLLMTLQVLLTSLLVGNTNEIKKIGTTGIIYRPRKPDDYIEEIDDITSKSIEIEKNIIDNIEVHQAKDQNQIIENANIQNQEQIEKKEVVEEVIENSEIETNIEETIEYIDIQETPVEDIHEYQIEELNENKNDIQENTIPEEHLEIMETFSEDIISKPENELVDSSNKEISVIDKILLDDTSLGSHGRLYFDSLRSVRLNNVSLSEKDISQSVVDSKDSAAIFNFGNCVVIADHNNQEFAELKNVQVGDSAYIKYVDLSIDSYICMEKTIGKNTGYELVIEDGRIVSEISNCDIVMYTCNDDWQNVTITLWKKCFEKNKVLLK